MKDYNIFLYILLYCFVFWELITGNIIGRRFKVAILREEHPRLFWIFWIIEVVIVTIIFIVGMKETFFS